MINKISLIVALSVIGLAAHVSAQNTLQFVGNGYVILDINNGGDSFYDVNNQSNDSTTPSFDTDNSTPTAFSRTFTINQGQSILLGGELQTFQQNVGATVSLGYGITNLTETSGSFSELNLPFQMTSGANDQWQQLASTSGVQIGSSLAPGNYLLAVYEHAQNGSANLYNNEGGQGGNNWEAEITVLPVPEPGTIISFLSGSSVLGAMMFIRRRRA